MKKNIVHTLNLKYLIIFGAIILMAAPIKTNAQFDREWKVYLIPFSHTDVGYTASVPTVIEQQKNYLDTVVSYIKRSSQNNEGEKYKWTIEASWVMDLYMKSRSSNQIDTLIKYIRKGDIELGGMYLGLQTDLCGPEELVRSLYYSKQLSFKNNFNVKTILIDDTPGFTWSLAQLLNQAELPYFATALNSFLCNFFTTTKLPYLFYWKSQQGKRTLVWRNIDKNWAYLEGKITQQAFSDYQNMKLKITQLLQQLQNEGYPYDAIFINCSSGDNGAPDYKLVENAVKWNSENSQAKIKLSTAAGFFDYLQNKYSSQIPEYSGDAPNWWTWMFAPSATAGAALSHATQNLLPTSEIFSAIYNNTFTYNYPKDDFNQSYVNNLLFEDHNLGTVNSVGDAEFWNYKMGWINSANNFAKENLKQSLGKLSSNIPTQNNITLAVYNSLAWKRNEIIITSLDELNAKGISDFTLIDNSTNKEIKPQYIDGGKYAFYAQDVPAFGYKTYSVIPGISAIPATGTYKNLHLENENYSADINSASGDIKSLIDKETKKELTKTDGVFNRYLLNSSQFQSGMQIISGDSGAYVQRLKLKGTAAGTKSYETEIILTSFDKKIIFNNNYDRLPTTTTESVDFKFGFGLSSPKLRYEIPFGAVNIFSDEMTGFRTGHYAVQNWINISSAADNTNVTISPAGTGVVACPAGSFDGTLRIMVSYNNPASNYRAGIGPLNINYAITSGTGAGENLAAKRFGDQFNSPLIVKYISGHNIGIMPADKYSFMSSEKENIAASTIKKAEDDRGFIVRLYNPSNSQANEVLAFADKIKSAYETTLIENDIASLPFADKKISLSMTPYEVKTIRVEFDKILNVSDASQPFNFILNQNYPNPFNPSTKISFTVPKKVNVAIKVYNILGKQICTLSDKEYETGNHEVYFNAGNLSSGIYFYRIEAGGFSQTKKMALIK